MAFFAVSLLSECRVAGVLPPHPKHELAIHIVQAQNAVEARARGAKLGVGRQHTYRNSDEQDVSWVFRRVVECQALDDRELTDGMEVSSWLYEGERLCLNDGWLKPSRPT